MRANKEMFYQNNQQEPRIDSMSDEDFNEAEELDLKIHEEHKASNHFSSINN